MNAKTNTLTLLGALNSVAAGAVTWFGKPIPMLHYEEYLWIPGGIAIGAVVTGTLVIKIYARKNLARLWLAIGSTIGFGVGAIVHSYLYEHALGLDLITVAFDLLTIFLIFSGLTCLALLGELAGIDQVKKIIDQLVKKSAASSDND